MPGRSEHDRPRIATCEAPIRLVATGGTPVGAAYIWVGLEKESAWRPTTPRRNVAASESARPAPPRSRVRSGIWAISMSAPRIRGSRPISAPATEPPAQLEAEYKGQLAELGRRRPRGDDRALRGDRGRHRPGVLVRAAAVRGQPRRPGGRPVLPGHAGAGHRDRHQAAVRDAGAQQARGRAAGRDDRGLRAAAALPPLARHGPQLPPAPAVRRGRAHPAREARRPAAAPGSACSTRRWRPCASRSTARS